VGPVAHPARPLIRLLLRELTDLPDGTRVLSVGEGDGRYVEELARAFPRLRFVAFDIDPGAVARIASRKHAHGITNLQAFVGDADRIPLRTKSIDVAYVRSVLPWLLDPEAHVREIARTTRSVVVYRDVLNGPFYVLNRRLQSAFLRLRGKRSDAELMVRVALRANAMATTRAHGLSIARWLRRTRLFSRVELLGTDLLWWDLDRSVPVLGLCGAKISLRCVVAPPALSR